MSRRPGALPLRTAAVSISGATIADTLATAALAATNTQVSADANQITSMARANIATNVLSVDIGNVDMTEAFFESDQSSPAVASAGGTNLALLGSAQENTAAVDSSIDAASGASSVTASASTTCCGTLNSWST